jgi:hypothetical protein
MKILKKKVTHKKHDNFELNVHFRESEMNVQITTSTFIQSQDITIITDANTYKIQMKHILQFKVIKNLSSVTVIDVTFSMQTERETYAVKCHLICE